MADHGSIIRVAREGMLMYVGLENRETCNVSYLLHYWTLMILLLSSLQYALRCIHSNTGKQTHRSYNPSSRVELNC